MRLFIVILTFALCVACQSTNQVPLPAAPEWKKIGEVYNYNWPKLHRDFDRNQIEARMIPGYPISELWVKSDKAYLCGMAVKGWHKVPGIELWQRTFTD